MFAFMIYTIYLTRLINSEIPNEPKRPGMYIAVGPASYTSNTLVALGMQAPKYIPPGFLNTPSDIPVGYIWQSVGVATGIFIWLLGFWFSALSTVSVLWGIKKMHFTLNQWGVIFPNVGLTIAAIYIGRALDSAGIKAVTSAMSMVLVALWFLTAVMNIWALYKKQVLWPGMDEDMEDVGGQPEQEDLWN
jgi:tellurite resistance protein TehA-like permease